MKLWAKGTCPHPGCEREIADTSFCCIRHWKVLPRGLRIRLRKPPTGQTYQDQERKALRIWAENDEGPPPKQGAHI